MRRPDLRDVRVLTLLGLLPLLAHAPAWWESRLLGPGDGAALHLPLRAQSWAALAQGELPFWNPTIFSGTPLLAAYRAGALYPPMAALSPLEPFVAFQILVLLSLSASAMLTFVYLRRLGAGRLGAYVSGLCYSLGPYLVGHLGDTASIVASPLLPLLLLAAEAHLSRTSAWRTTGLAVAWACVLLAGSPEAARAGAAILAGRLLVGHLLWPHPKGPSWRASSTAVLAGLALAGPQILPTLLAFPEAGRQVTDLTHSHDGTLPGLTGLILRYVSHTPAAPLALAAVPLVTTHRTVRVLGLTLALCLALQWGRGPLAAPGALALVFDLALCFLAGLAISAQWQARLSPLGARLRAHFLFACLTCAAALSVSAAAIGPLPQLLAGAVGVLALSLILHFSLATARDPILAGVWLLPLTVSFLLQPHGRQIWQGAPTRAELEAGTPTRAAIDRAMGQRRSERVLTLTREWPRVEELDLAYAGLGALSGRTSANGYDPMVPLRTRQVFDGMGPGGTLLGAFFRSDPARLDLQGVRWVQAPSSALMARTGPGGLGDTLDIVLEHGRPRFFPLPIRPATELRVGSWLSDSTDVRDGEAVARVLVRVTSGRHLPLVIRAGQDTAEWAYDRADVRPRVAHRRAPILDSRPERGFLGHRYLARLPLPSRYLVNGFSVERLPGPGQLTLGQLGLVDGVSGQTTPVSLASGYLSDRAHFREVAATPAVWLFELPHSLGHAWVTPRLRLLADDDDVLGALAGRGRAAPGREALAVVAEATGVTVPAGGQVSAARVLKATGNRIEVRAVGPGLLVVAESWDPGWSARLDGQSARLLRVNHSQIGLPLPEGPHRISLSHRPRGFAAGLLVMLVAVGVLGVDLARESRRRTRRYV